jgi:DNA-binding beta-propeller fold protein YncE
MLAWRPAWLCWLGVFLAFASDKLYAISHKADVLGAFWAFDGQLVLDWELPRLESSMGDGADIQVTPSGKYLYATNLDPENSIAMYDVSGIDPVHLGHEPSRGSSPLSLAIDPAEELVIVGNMSSPPGLEIFSIQADGTLQHEATEPTSFTPFYVGVAAL